MRLLILFSLFFAVTAFTIIDNKTERYDATDNVELAEDEACRCLNGRCVTDNRGRKKCACFPKHAPVDKETCQLCDCGERGECTFFIFPGSNGRNQYQKKCVCHKGSAEKDGYCYDCQCGANSKCEFEGEEKICYCEDGYSEKDGVCTRCNCGDYGYCKFEMGQKTCSCFPDFEVNDGFCEKCDCGTHSRRCFFNNGNKHCDCDEGHVQAMGECRVACGAVQECHNGGVCRKGLCTCHSGTSGDFCEKVNECRYLCPKSEDVKCIYDITKRQAVCQCTNSALAYDPQAKMCRLSCGAEDRCQNGGVCTENKVCGCLRGTRGDHCEIVDRCKSDSKYCGVKSDVDCVYDVSTESAACECRTRGKIFDRNTMTCKVQCGAGKQCNNGGTCTIYHVCTCLKGTSGDLCERVDRCESDKYYCGGEIDAECFYNVFSKKADCKCRTNGKVFDLKSKICKYRCDAVKTCGNGGICAGSVCSCLEGTSGDHCKTVDRCESDSKYCGNGNDVDCVYDIDSKAASCKCRAEGKVFDRNSKTCRFSCDKDEECQNGGICKSKICSCLTGTSGDHCEVVDTCWSDSMYCGDGNDTVCVYDINSKTASCICKVEGKEFAKNEKTCKYRCDAVRNCKNGGTCADNVCNCLQGTSGDHCEIVDRCQSYMEYCGDGNDVDCVYDVPSKAAKCKCRCKGKLFDRSSKTCRLMCSAKQKCENGGKCTENRVCSCLNGTSGDNCEVVDECQSNIPYCGDGTDVDCVYDVSSEMATCKCRTRGKMFDRNTMSCKISCSDHDCMNGGVCEGGQTKFCRCRKGTSGDHCEKVDQCDWDRTFCGMGHDVDCFYDVTTSKARCKCHDERKRYDRNSKTCREPCNYFSCKNGGICKDIGEATFCDCLPGVSGDMCDDIHDCQIGRLRNCKGEKGTCTYDTVNESAKCICGRGKRFDNKTNTCKNVNPCDPDPCVHGRCVVEDQDFECLCRDPYTGRFCEISTCLTVECWGGRCKHDGLQEECVCPDGHTLQEGSCKKTVCTERTCTDGKCEVIDDKEVCRCYEGYVLEGDYCRKLICSNTPCINGTCIVRYGNVEECVCPAGFTLDQDTCRKGLCHTRTCFGGHCKTIDGELVCVCPEGYHNERNGCFATICVKQNCFGGECVVKDGEEICTCRDGYVLVNDVCKKILCERKSCFGGQCHLVDGREECTCPSGFSIYEDVCREDTK